MAKNALTNSSATSLEDSLVPGKSSEALQEWAKLETSLAVFWAVQEGHTADWKSFVKPRQLRGLSVGYR